MTLVLHCGGTAASYDDIKAVVTPCATRTYSPIPYTDIIDATRYQLEDVLGLEIHNEAFGLNRDGNQFFGVISCRTADDTGLAVGLRSSHDKSLSAAMCLGQKVFVCDNMAFGHGDVRVMRQHRGSAWAAFEGMLRRHIRRAVDADRELTMDFEAMKQITVTQDRGYELIGQALGHDVLKPTQANIAVRDWRNPRHQVESFQARTLYALYQCFTEGLKKGPVSTVIDRHAATHEFFLGHTPRA